MTVTDVWRTSCGSSFYDGQILLNATKVTGWIQTLRLNFSRLQLSYLAAPVNTMFCHPPFVRQANVPRWMTKTWYFTFILALLNFVKMLNRHLLDAFAQWDSCWYFGGNWVFDFVLRIEVSEPCLFLAQHQSAANQINFSTKQQTKPESKCLTMTQEFIKHKFIFGFNIASRCV